MIGTDDPGRALMDWSPARGRKGVSVSGRPPGDAWATCGSIPPTPTALGVTVSICRAGTGSTPEGWLDRWCSGQHTGSVGPEALVQCQPGPMKFKLGDNMATACHCRQCDSITRHRRQGDDSRFSCEVCGTERWYAKAFGAGDFPELTHNENEIIHKARAHGYGPCSAAYPTAETQAQSTLAGSKKFLAQRRRGQPGAGIALTGQRQSD